MVSPNTTGIIVLPGMVITVNTDTPCCMKCFTFIILFHPLYNPKGVRLLQLFLHFTHEETEAQSGSITRSKSHDWESDTGRFQGSAIWLPEWSLDHEAVSPL